MARIKLPVIRHTMPSNTLTSIIRHTATLAEASASRQPICEYAHGSKGHQDYQQLTEEIVQRTRKIAGSTLKNSQRTSGLEIHTGSKFEPA